MINLKTSFIILTLGFMIACGKAPDYPELQQEQVIFPADGSNIKGAYTAVFLSLNSNINGFVEPVSYIMRTEDQFKAYVSVPKSSPFVWHKQDIYYGGRCPNEKDDANNDGFLDYAEASKVWGKAIIPLDGSLEGQSAGEGNYPLGNAEGAYYYKRVASFKSLFSDLKKPDQNPSDDLIKLRKNQGFNPETAVLIIFGTSLSSNLPDTVASDGTLQKHHSLPIACGLYKKINSLPVGVDQGDSGPVGLWSEETIPPPPVEPVPVPVPTEPQPEQFPPTEPTPPDDDDGDWRRRRWRDWWPDDWEPGR